MKNINWTNVVVTLSVCVIFWLFVPSPLHKCPEFVDIPEKLRPCLRVIRVSDYKARHFLRIILEEEKSYAVAFLMRDEE